MGLRNYLSGVCECVLNSFHFSEEEEMSRGQPHRKLHQARRRRPTPGKVKLYKTEQVITVSILRGATVSVLANIIYTVIIIDTDYLFNKNKTNCDGERVIRGIGVKANFHLHSRKFIRNI